MMKDYDSRTIEGLIRWFNSYTGQSFKTDYPKHMAYVEDGLMRANGDTDKLKEHIAAWWDKYGQEAKASMPYATLGACMKAYKPTEVIEEMSTLVAVSDADVSAALQEVPNKDQVVSSFDILGKVVADVVAKTQSDQISQQIMSNVQNEVRSFIKNEYGTIERKVCTVVDGKRTEFTGVVHEKFDTVLKFVSNDEPVFLVGPAGSGKNHICKQVAEALGLKFYFSNAVTQEYKLTGFTDANGNYQPTQFYKAFTQGGVFMLDEIDASIPEVLVILNAAIANRYFDFPAPIGYVEAHPDFRIIAAGNTTGNGADYDYVGRNQLDMASLDRFAIVEIDYSEAIENAMAASNIALADFCREFRAASVKCGIHIVVSYRAIQRLAKMTQLLELPEALKTCLIKGLESDDLNIICKELHRSKYRDALKMAV